jgi:serine/threonine protein kinase
MWSVGCVIAEMVINRPIFEGENSLDQLAKIMKILGTPTHHDIIGMKAKELTHELPAIQPISLKKYLTKLNPNVDIQLVLLLSRIFVYDPYKRITPTDALKDPYFS